jgi:hypothetical protein
LYSPSAEHDPLQGFDSQTHQVAAPPEADVLRPAANLGPNLRARTILRLVTPEFRRKQIELLVAEGIRRAEVERLYASFK